MKPQDRLLRDAKILVEMKRRGLIRDVDYDIDGVYKWIAIYGAFQLPADRFNFRDANIKLLVPESLYEPSDKGRFHFYDVILIDSKLRIKGRNGGWQSLPRQISMYPDEERKGWRYLCIKPHDAWEKTDVRSVIAQVQEFVLRRGGE